MNIECAFQLMRYIPLKIIQKWHNRDNNPFSSHYDKLCQVREIDIQYREYIPSIFTPAQQFVCLALFHGDIGVSCQLFAPAFCCLLAAIRHADCELIIYYFNIFDITANADHCAVAVRLAYDMGNLYVIKLVMAHTFYHSYSNFSRDPHLQTRITDYNYIMAIAGYPIISPEQLRKISSTGFYNLFRMQYLGRYLYPYITQEKLDTLRYYGITGKMSLFDKLLDIILDSDSRFDRNICENWISLIFPSYGRCFGVNVYWSRKLRYSQVLYGQTVKPEVLDLCGETQLINGFLIGSPISVVGLYYMRKYNPGMIVSDAGSATVCTLLGYNFTFEPESIAVASHAQQLGYKVKIDERKLNERAQLIRQMVKHIM